MSEVKWIWNKSGPKPNKAETQMGHQGLLDMLPEWAFEESRERDPDGFSREEASSPSSELG